MHAFTLVRVFMAYVDESGNIGVNGSKTYSLACVFLEDTAWAGTFDDLIEFRRFLKRRFGVPVRAEVKANFLLSNHGIFRSLGLSESARFAIYRGCMRIQPKLGLSTFAIVIQKDRLFVR